MPRSRVFHSSLMLPLAIFAAGCFTQDAHLMTSPSGGSNPALGGDASGSQPPLHSPDPPDPPSCIEVFVELPSRNHTLVKGQVVNRRWEPIANATVEAISGPGTPAAARTDSAGCYHLVVLRGSWTLRASAEGYETDRWYTEIREQERDRVNFHLKRVPT